MLEYRPGLPIAVIEAKREYAIPGKGMQQAKNYAQRLDVPLAYATNGKGIVEDDRDAGHETENLDSFPGPDELWVRYRAFRGLDARLAADGVALPFNRSLRNFDGSVKEPRYYQRTAINPKFSLIASGCTCKTWCFAIFGWWLLGYASLSPRSSNARFWSSVGVVSCW